ncbi:hypothetical protein V490_03413 [Pseudogymnoascus sp. VKM F-3557]|nr:hypothetical protein V490_03413 [Pseudogymnoascus sp. VKM F-3557]
MTPLSLQANVRSRNVDQITSLILRFRELRLQWFRSKDDICQVGYSVTASHCKCSGVVYCSSEQYTFLGLVTWITP